MRHGTFQHSRPKPVVFRSTLFRVLTVFHGRPHGRCTACAPSQSTTPGSSFPPKNGASTLFGKPMLSVPTHDAYAPRKQAFQNWWRRPESNWRLPACKAGTLPLRYVPMSCLHRIMLVSFGVFVQVAFETSKVKLVLMVGMPEVESGSNDL